MFNSNDDDQQFAKIAAMAGKIQIQNMIRAHNLRANPKQVRHLETHALPGLSWADYATEDNFELQSPEAWHLLDRLLAIDPNDRYTAAEALAHPYFQPIRDCWTRIPAADWQTAVPDDLVLNKRL